jgi:hypothetical protein
MIWRTVGPMTKHSREYLAPSWSWACGIGGVRFYGCGLDDGHLISVLDARTHSSSSDVTDRLSAGFIKIKGPVVRATVVRAICGATVRERAVISGILQYASTDSSCQLSLETWPPKSVDMACLGSLRQINSRFTAPPKPGSRSITPVLSDDISVTYLDINRSLLLLGMRARFRAIGDESFCHLVGLILKPTSSSSDLFVRTGTFRVKDWEEMEKFGVCVNREDGSFRLNERVKPTVITIV